MGKTTTSNRLKKSLRKSDSLILNEHRPQLSSFDNSQAVKEALSECILNSDLEAFEDVLLAYIRSQSKTKLSQKTKLGRQTLYDLLAEGRKFNPEWETLKIILETID